MVRWRPCLLLAMLLLLPARTGSKSEEEEDEESLSSPQMSYFPSSRGEDNDEDEDDEEDDEEEEQGEKTERATVRRPPAILPTSKALSATRTAKKRPLECYVCAYKSETPLRACLDPTKYRVHTITCHSTEDKCFTSVMSKGSMYEAVVRGCRSSCIGSTETTCCELNRCNNQAFAMPVISPHSLTDSKSSKTIPPTIFFFVTVLLVLQTVVKVAFV